MRPTNLTRLILLVVMWNVVLTAELNERPIIGVLTQESEKVELGQSYFPDSYVNYLQMAGARVVPVMIFQDDSYYEELFKNINGVLFPGGWVSTLTSGYAKAAQKIFKMAKQANDAGDYFPLWGTCLGHELMFALVSGKNLMASTDAEDYIIPLNLTADAKQSRMLKNIPDDVLKIVTSWNVTANFHHFGFTPTNFTKNVELQNFFKLISTNVDRRGKTFISSMEAYRYPFYSTQWHPEVNMYRWDIRKHVNHSAGAVKLSQYLADFFVSETRKSSHHFPNVETESQQLIYNYQPVYLGLPSYELNYYFNYSHDSSISYGTDNYWNKAVKVCAYHARYLHGLALLWYVVILPLMMFLLCGSRRRQTPISVPVPDVQVDVQDVNEKMLPVDIYPFSLETEVPTSEEKIRLV